MLDKRKMCQCSGFIIKTQCLKRVNKEDSIRVNQNLFNFIKTNKMKHRLYCQLFNPMFPTIGKCGKKCYRNLMRQTQMGNIFLEYSTVFNKSNGTCFFELCISFHLKIKYFAWTEI